MACTSSVLLRHDLPDGTWHYDWLIDPVGVGEPEERSLIAFRLSVRPDEAKTPFDAVRLPDHRRRYLDYEGGIGGDGGTVKRIARYECRVETNRPDLLVVVLSTARGETVWFGVPVREGIVAAEGAVWRFARQGD